MTTLPARLLGVAAVIAGPAVVLYAHTDLGTWSPWWERFLFSIPLGLFASAAFCYVLTVGVSRGEKPLILVAASAIGCLLIPYGTWYLALPFLFAIGTNAPCVWTTALIASILALPTALFQVLLPPGHGRRIFEFLAHICVSGAVALLIAAFVTKSACVELPSTPEKLFDTWPVLFSLAPYVALVVTTDRRVPIVRIGIVLAVAVSVPYVAKAVADARHQPVAQAAIWPVRVWNEFTGWPERHTLIRRLTATGMPVRIGEHWYNFEKARILSYEAANIRRPDRLARLQLEVSAKDLDLADVVAADRRIVLNILVANAPVLGGSLRPRPMQEMERGDNLAVQDDDLMIVAWRMPGSSEQREAVRNRIRKFIQEARVEPPKQ